MGYFSNGTEGDIYESRYCSKCIHQDDEHGCPVMLAHILFAYEECQSGSNAETMLNLLIPMAKDGLHNDECAMFCPASLKTLHATQIDDE